MFHPGRTRALDLVVDETLGHAARAPFYKSRWPARRPAGLAGLATLPLLRKSDAAEHQESLVVPGVASQAAGLEAGVLSSATTRDGRPFRVLRSPDERGPPGPRQDTVQLYSPKHGVRPTSSERVLVPAVPHINTVDVLLDLLERSRPPITTLVSTLSGLKWITVALEQRGLDAAGFGLEAIGTTGYALTEAARRWLADRWSCPLFDNYSLSEVPGYATECADCSDLHWAAGDVVLELVDAGSGASTRKKTGELVVTTLVPGVLRMPLIRYATGDLVELRGKCRGRARFRWRGRVAHSLLRDGKLLVASRDLLELGEATPEIAQHPHPAERLGLVPPSDLGLPKILVREGRVVCELRYDPARFPERAASLAVEVKSACAPRTAVPIELLPPGALDLSRLAAKL